MSCFEVQVLEPNINTVEIETCIDGQVTSLDIIQYDITSLEVTHCIALLPSDYDTIVSGIIPVWNILSGTGISVSSNSGIFTVNASGLQPSGNYSLVGHNHLSSDITNFDSSVSGLLPVKNILSGSGIQVTENSGAFTVAVTGNFGLTSEEVDDKVGSLLNAGQNIFLDYNDSGNFLTISTVGLQPSGDYSLVGHYHNSSDILDFITSVSGLLPNSYDAAVPWTPNHTLADGTRYLAGDLVHENGRLYKANYDNESLPVSNTTYWTDVGPGYRLNIDGRDIPNIPYPVMSVNGHIGDVELSTLDLDDFTNAVSGLLPSIPSVSGVGYIVSDFTNNTYIISATGLQPGGDYSIVGHSHVSNDITDFNTSVSGLLIPYAQLNSPSFSGVPTVPTAASGTNTDQVASTSFVRTEISNLVNAAPSTLDTLNELALALGGDPNFATTVASGLSQKSNIGHTHTSSNIIDFSSSVSGLLPSVTGAGYVTSSFADNIYIIGVTGLQPSGNYSLVGHTHTTNDITDFNTAVSGLIPPSNFTSLTGVSGITISNNDTNYTVSLTDPTTQLIDITDLSPNARSFLLTPSSSNLSSLITDETGSGILVFNDSPSLSGIPTTPTAASGTNNNQIANTAFVRTEISNLVNSAPSTLDTLNELAIALGNDPNFATTITNSLASKAALGGAIFTGSVTIPSGTGNFNTLTVNNTGVSLNGHLHSTSDITNFNSSVSGLLPSVSGSGYVNSSFNDNIYTISVTGLQPSGNYSIIGHSHQISDVSGLQISLDSKQPSGIYASGIHYHTSSDVTDFNSSVSGLLPVKSIIGGSGIQVGSLSGIYTITSFGVAAASASSLVTEVYNNNLYTIPKMSVVYINGGQGNLPTISLAIANGESGSSKTYGITAEDITSNNNGDVIIMGALIDLNTSQFSAIEGTTLYLSPSISGGITTTKPLAPNHLVSVGTIVRNHNNQGIIEVKIQNGFELGELHNVSTNGSGDGGKFLQYNSSSGLWVSSNSGNFTTLQVNGTGVSVSGHSHVSSDITNFNSSVSGLLPSVSGSSYIISNFANNIYTITATGLQPSGNYSIVGHSHLLSDLSNINGDKGDILVSSSGLNWQLKSESVTTETLASGLIIDCGLLTYAVASTDPYFSQVNLLAHFNNINNSTIFTDNSSFNRTLTRTGTTAVISTTQSKFGGSSLYLGAAGGSSHLTSNNINVGIQDYVMEGWFYFNSLVGTYGALMGWSPDGLFVGFGDNKLFISENESDSYSASSPLLINTWHHIAWVRRYNHSVNIYCDGLAVWTSNFGTTWGRTSNMGSTPILVGGSSSFATSKNFYIDDFRLTVGQARYNGNFTPPTTQFEDS